VPFYQSSRDAVQSELATFFAVFPEGLVWGNDTGGHGYDSLLIGGTDPLRVEVDALQARLARPDHMAVRRSLAEVRLDSVADLLGSYVGRAADLQGWLAQAEINRDRSLRLQYLAGLSFYSRAGAAAYGELLGFRRFPADLFRGSDANLNPLREKLPAPAQSTGDKLR
jgi:spermidine synthase